MAVAFDAASESHTGTSGSASEASYSWDHTPSGTPRGVVVFVFINSSTTLKQVYSVTYAGEALTEITAATAVDTSTETGRVRVYVLGSGVPTDSPATVQVNRTNNSIVQYAVCVTLTADYDTEVYEAGIVLLEEDGSLTEQSVDDGSPGTNSLRLAGVNSGSGTPPAAGASSTAVHGIDFGSRSASVVRETTAGQGARSVGFSASSDDRAATHFAVREILTTPQVQLSAAMPAPTATVHSLVQAGLAAAMPAPTAAIDQVVRRPARATIELEIANGSDDGFDLEAGDYFNTDETLQAGQNSAKLTVGLRFPSVAIDQGATILSATLGFNVTSRAGSPDIDWHGVDADNQGQFANSVGQRPRDATKTTAFTNFTASGTGARTIDVTAIVQEIVDRAGWVSGNAIALVTDDNVGTGMAYYLIEAYENAGTAHATLTIVASVTPGGTMPAPTATVTAEFLTTNVQLSAAMPAPTAEVYALQFATLAAAMPSPTADIATLQYALLQAAMPSPSAAVVALFLSKLLTAAMPAPTGELSIGSSVFLDAAMPAPTATLTPLFLSKLLQAAMPSPTAEIAALQYAALAASMPAPTAEVYAKLFATLSATMPAPAGTLFVRQFTLLEAALPAPSATVTAQQFLARALEAAMPAPAGALTVAMTERLSAAMPAPTATLAVEYLLRHITLSAAMPSPTAGLSLHYLFRQIALAAAMPAPTAELVALNLTRIAIGRPAPGSSVFYGPRAGSAVYHAPKTSASSVFRRPGQGV